MMEKKYQHMMEQVNMDEGFASGLLEQIQAERPQKRPRPLRTALIAACVCLALVGTAVAANSDVVRQYFGTILLANEEEYDKMIEEMEETIWDRGNDAPAALPGLSAPSGKIERRTPGNNRAEWIENKTRSWENRLSLSSVSGSDSSVIDVAAVQKGTTAIKTFIYDNGYTMERYWDDSPALVLVAAGLPFTMDSAPLEGSYAPVSKTFGLDIERNDADEIKEIALIVPIQSDGDGWFNFDYYYHPEVEYMQDYTLESYYDVTGTYMRSDGIQIQYEMKDYTFWGRVVTNSQYVDFSFFGQNLTEEELLVIFEQFDLSGAVNYVG